MVSAIIVAAGSSRRMGFDKLLTPLAGKPVLWHSLKAFSDCKQIDEMLVVTREEQMDLIEKLVTDEKFKKVRKVISGGNERHISVWNGLQAIESHGSEFIAIHDGARPLTTPKLIRACLDLARVHGRRVLRLADPGHGEARKRRADGHRIRRADGPLGDANAASV
jgi:2-C-methyl-D-erythritol 4-phosphate cytidylyltransferase